MLFSLLPFLAHTTIARLMSFLFAHDHVLRYGAAVITESGFRLINQYANHCYRNARIIFKKPARMSDSASRKKQQSSTIV